MLIVYSLRFWKDNLYWIGCIKYDALWTYNYRRSNPTSKLTFKAKLAFVGLGLGLGFLCFGTACTRNTNISRLNLATEIACACFQMKWTLNLLGPVRLLYILIYWKLRNLSIWSCYKLWYAPKNSQNRHGHVCNVTHLVMSLFTGRAGARTTDLIVDWI